jgi:hypothetical protein
LGVSVGVSVLGVSVLGVSVLGVSVLGVSVFAALADWADVGPAWSRVRDVVSAGEVDVPDVGVPLVWDAVPS